MQPAATFGDRYQASRCSGCSTKRRPTTLEYCKECDQCLCERCAGVHRNLRSTRDHHVVDQRQRVLVNCYSAMLCSLHPTKSLQIFCTDCESLCCVACLREVHRDHTWCDVDQASMSFRQQLSDDVETVRKEADRCEEKIRRLADAEKMLAERVEAAKSQIDAQRDHLIDAIDREVTQLHDDLSQAQNSNVVRLQRSRDQIKKQKRILQCFENFCQLVIETGTVQEVIHVHGCVHVEDEDLALQQQVRCDAELIPDLRFAPVDVQDYLPQEDRRLIGSLFLGDETAISQPTWNQLMDQLNQTVEQADQLQHQLDNQQHRTTCLEGQLAEKTELIDKVSRELDEESTLVDELERQMAEKVADVEEKEAVIISLREELQQRNATLDKYSKQVDDLSQRLHDTEENYKSQLLGRELKVEQRTQELCQSEQSVAEYRVVVDELSVRVQQLEESLSYSADKAEQMETQLEDAWQQISEQSIVIDHVPPTAGQSVLRVRFIVKLISDIAYYYAAVLTGFITGFPVRQYGLRTKSCRKSYYV